MTTRKHTAPAKAQPAARSKPARRPSSTYTTGRFRALAGVPAAGYPKPLPCPFCGANEDVELRRVPDVPDVLPFYTWAECCGSQGPFADSPKGAAKRWNQRTSFEEYQGVAVALLEKNRGSTRQAQS